MMVSRFMSHLVAGARVGDGQREQGDGQGDEECIPHDSHPPLITTGAVPGPEKAPKTGLRFTKDSMSDTKSEHPKPLLLLSLSALGVVFGDLGTSPLYALQEAFHGTRGVPPAAENVIGMVSLF